jgi:ribosomal protein S18 acetylase RimI-like enzyme
VASIDLRTLRHADTALIPPAFSALGWPGKTAELYERYLADQTAGDRLVFVAEADAGTGGASLSSASLSCASSSSASSSSTAPSSAPLTTAPLTSTPLTTAPLTTAPSATVPPTAARAGVFAGYVTVVWVSGYRPFAEAGIPEIQDLNVLPQFRRRGIASALMDAAEAAIAARAETAGIGVGLYADYGAAQLMYLRRGYLPDGRGIAYRGATVAPATRVPVDDDLVLMMARRLHAPGAGA